MWPRSIVNDDPHIGGVELYDDAACGLVLTQENGIILRTNLAFRNLLEVAESELVGKRFQDLLTPGGRIFHQTHWLPLMRMQGSVREVKLEIRSQQRKISVLINGIRREKGGEFLHHLAIFEASDRDAYEREIVAARKSAEDALEQKTIAEVALMHARAELELASLKALERAEFAEQMVAVASHDLKTPLAAIIMASQLLRRKLTPQQGRDAKLIGHITHSAERADKMIRDLLDYTVIRVGRGIQVNLAPVHLHQLTASSVAELAIAFPHATLRHKVIGPSLASLDKARIEQILSNLVANSVAYGDTDRPITIVSGIKDGNAWLSVHNFGPEISASTREVLFKPMSQGEHTNSIRSVGLGLFIVSEVINAHGGSVEVESAENVGTTFTVHLRAMTETSDVPVSI